MLIVCKSLRTQRKNNRQFLIISLYYKLPGFISQIEKIKDNHQFKQFVHDLCAKSTPLNRSERDRVMTEVLLCSKKVDGIDQSVA